MQLFDTTTLCAATSTLVWTISHAFLSSMQPHTCLYGMIFLQSHDMYKNHFWVLGFVWYDQIIACRMWVVWITQSMYVHFDAVSNRILCLDPHSISPHASCASLLVAPPFSPFFCAFYFGPFLRPIHVCRYWALIYQKSTEGREKHYHVVWTWV